MTADKDAFMAVASEVIKQSALPQMEFTVGVMSVIVKAFICGASPRLLPLYTLLQWPVILFFVVRGWTRTRYLLYLTEFCWCVNAVGWLAVSAELMQSAGWLHYSLDAATRVTAARAFFIVANGPLAFTVLLNRNRLVFHDPVKTSGFWIHFSPALTTWALMWRPDVSDRPIFALNAAEPVGGAFSPVAIWDLYLAPLAVYGAWCVTYGVWLLTYTY